MDRGARRQLDRDLRKLMAADGDRCSVCGVDFRHNSKTFYGRAKGKAAITGECCHGSLSVEVGSGLYVQGDYDVLHKGGPGKAAARPSNPAATINQMQAAISSMDVIADSAATRGGMTSDRRQVSLGHTRWKSADAAWFAAHPDRAHRLRALLPGEQESFPPGVVPADLPENHEIQVVIRQVEPGQRIRVPFGRNLTTDIPDQEPVIHALFDAVSARQGRGPEISSEEIARTAARYAGPKPTLS